MIISKNVSIFVAFVAIVLMTITGASALQFSTLKEGCVVITYENPINTSSNKTKAILVEETSGMRIKTTNRIIDSHNATIAEIRNNTAGSLVEYRALYWIDEVDGMATKGNIVFSTYPWDEGTETLLNTIHVKEGSH